MDLPNLASSQYSPIGVLLNQIDRLEHLASSVSSDDSKDFLLSRVQMVANRVLVFVAWVPFALADVTWRLGVTVVSIPGAIAKLLIGHIPLKRGNLGSQFPQAFKPGRTLHSLYSLAVALPTSVLALPIVIISPSTAIQMYKSLSIHESQLIEDVQTEPSIVDEVEAVADETQEPLTPNQDTENLQMQGREAELTQVRQDALQEKSDLEGEVERLEREIQDKEAELTQARQDALQEKSDLEGEVARLEREIQDKEGELVQMRQNALQEKQEVLNHFDLSCEHGEYLMLNQTIGQGDVKVIHKGLSQSFEPVAISVLSLEEQDDFFKKFWVQEPILQAWKASASQNEGGGVGKILDVHTTSRSDGSTQYLVQPYYQGPSLWDYLQHQEEYEIDLKDRIHISTDILNGFRNLHEHQLIQGDPKAQNIQLHRGETRWQAFVLDSDLAQFGVVSPLDTDPDYQAKKAYLGAPGTWSPEIFLSEDMSEVDRFKAESWAVGVMMTFLFVNSPKFVANIFSGIQQAKDALDEEQDSYSQDDIRNEFNLRMNIEGYNTFRDWFDWNSATMIDDTFNPLLPVIKKLLEPDPKDRPTLKEIKPEFDRVTSELLA